PTRGVRYKAQSVPQTLHRISVGPLPLPGNNRSGSRLGRADHVGLSGNVRHPDLAVRCVRPLRQVRQFRWRFGSDLRVDRPRRILVLRFTRGWLIHQRTRPARA
ncbi:MAG: hypothetical protein ACK559_29300, partial [bacterium]